MNKVLPTVLAFGLVVLGVLYITKPTTVQVPEPQPVVGASTSNEHYNPEFFYNGLSVSKVVDLQYTSATTSSTTLATTMGGSNLGKATTGYLAIPTGSGTQTMYASTTAIDANSILKFTQIASATAPSLITALGTTLCNTTNATTSPMFRVFASTTNPTLNGFGVTVLNAPSTPLCYSFNISN